MRSKFLQNNRIGRLVSFKNLKKREEEREEGNGEGGAGGTREGGDGLMVRAKHKIKDAENRKKALTNVEHTMLKLFHK